MRERERERPANACCFNIHIREREQKGGREKRESSLTLLPLPKPLCCIRTLKKINSLLDLIQTFPRQNLLDDDIIALLDRIRGKFKTVASALQTAERYAEAPNSKMIY